MQFTPMPPPNVFVSSLACPDPGMVASEYLSPYPSPICSVNQSVIIITKHTPSGTVYIPIDDNLSSCCRRFYRRGENIGNEYALAEIYLVMKTESRFSGMLLQEETGVFNEMQRQLTRANFANSALGQFTRLASQLQKHIKVSRQGKRLMPIKSEQQHLEDALVVDFRPWYYDASSYPGYYTMEVSLLVFGGYVLPTSGTVHELLEMIRFE